MPAHCTRVFRTKAQKLNAEREKKIQDVCAILLASSSPNIRTAAKEHNVPYHTLRRHYLGLTQPCYKAHGHQQLLSPELEFVLVDWIKHLSSMGHPLSKWTIRIKAAVLSRKKPHEK
ncbi:hypothetical protein BDR06DRAFT_894488 [Suillus hirtellus]|nr:hypothetical protein BDR06DRAFT_894488 [Suillus hirtellus]